MVQEERLSYSEAVSALAINQSMTSCWKKQETAFIDMNGPVVFKLHSGPPSILKDIEEDLLDFIDLWHAKGHPVNRVVLMRKAHL